MRVLLILSAIGLSACIPYVVHDGPHRDVSALQVMTGRVNLVDGTKLDLGTLSDKPVVMVFASDSCLSCAEEVKHIKEHLHNAKQPPANVNLISVIVGADLEDAVDWKDRLEVAWRVGFDMDSDLFKAYCPQDTVPCTVVFTPKDGVVLREHGIVEVQRIVGLTGPWED